MSSGPLKRMIPSLDKSSAGATVAESRVKLSDEGPMPDLGGAVGWLNSAPLSRDSLRGKVVLVDVWTYSCINSLRQLPYLKSWDSKYKDAGLIIIGVHSPEFGFEKDLMNVQEAVRDLNLHYPIAIDSKHGIWNVFNNQYWPADYFINAKGRIRSHHFGEGDYAESERIIKELLKENGAAHIDGTVVNVLGKGIESPFSDFVQSPETYVGYLRTDNFTSPEDLAPDSIRTYSLPQKPGLNEWGLGGSWHTGPESAMLSAAPGEVSFRFLARDLHMVLSSADNGKPIHFELKLDGEAPGTNSGVDSAPDGTGEIREPRLYQLIRQKGNVMEHTFEIKFLDPGARAFSFTFG